MGRFRMAVVAVVTVVTAAALVGSCGNDTDPDGTDPDGTDPTTDTTRDRDRDQDRERVHQVVEEAVAACGDQDRERLRDQVQSRLRDRVGTAAYTYEPGTTLEVLEEEITVDGDQAEVRSRLRVRAQGEETDLQVQWRLRYEEGDWHLSELPPCLEGGTTPSTVRDQERDQEPARDGYQG